MNFRKIAAPLLVSLLLCGCGTKKDGGLMLHVGFDEGKGTVVADSAAGREGELSYVLSKTPFGTNQDPQWRNSGVEGGSLLFDGCSNYVSFENQTEDMEQFSVSVWAAPRMFEWDDPNAAQAGNAHLTAIVSQYNRQQKTGFLLGYQRFGKLCFEFGTGDRWVTIWADTNLSKYEWNYITAEFDGKAGTATMRLNGETVGLATVPTGSKLAAAGEKLYVGKNNKAEAIAAGTYNMFSGMMDELKLYSRPLTDAERTPAEAPAIAYEEIGLQNVLTEDIYKTQYHGGPYQHWMNEPHAPVYYNGMYHLFFQQNITGTYWRNISWGHLVSTDLVNWRPVKEAITPMENTVVPDGVWSGGAALDKNGVPLLFFTAGNDSFAKERMISNQNIGVAYPKDLSDPELIDWVVCDELAIEQKAGQGRPGEFRDSHIWKEDDTWYMLVCSGSSTSDGGTALLYTTDTLELLSDGTVDMNWVYHGPIYEMENQSITFGTSWELPILLPFTNEAGTVTRYAFFISPAPASSADNKVYYFVGDFDKETGKFTPDADFEKPHLLDYGSNVFTGPSMFVDPVSGNIYCVSIMQDQRNGAEEGASDWAHCVGLTRKIWLNDAGTDLMMAPIDALHSLEADPVVNLGQTVWEQSPDEILQAKLRGELNSASLEEANAALAQLDEDMLYLRLTVELGSAQEFSIHVKSGGTKDDTVFTYSVGEGTISAATRNRGKAAKTGYVSGPLTAENGILTAELYLDRSLVEAFFNDTKSVSVRSYADFTSRSIFLEADGTVTVLELYAAPMNSIYSENRK